MAVNCGFLLLGLVLCCGFAALRAQENPCEKGWHFYDGNCYYREDRERKSWENAQEICASKQANLVTINDEDEQMFLNGILGKKGSWCGLNNKDNKNVFVWVSGEASGYRYWAPKQPGKSSKRRCVHLQWARYNHKWVMLKCEKRRRFTCEKALEINPCDSNPCLNGGTCTADEEGYSCQCADQYTGDNCETEIDPCDSNPCLNGGTCIADGDGYSCQCTDQYTGDNCEIEIDPCDSNPCLNGGTCIADGDGYSCQCTDQYTGDNCEIEIVIDPCDSNPCLNGGTCTADGDGYSCQCTDQFTGERCGEPKSVCNPNPCQNGGNCYDLGFAYCHCPAGFNGDNCENVNCDSNPCKNGGTCFTDEAKRSFCKCPSGFTGTMCQGEVPSITQDPEDSTGLEGDDITLCCKAEGTPAPTYEWFVEGDLLPGKSSSSLDLNGLTIDDAGSYRCRATNDYGAVYSSEADLKVVAGSGDDSCDPMPKGKVETLPPGCTDSSGSNSVDVGICSHEPCVKRGEATGCGGEESTRQCCSPVEMSDIAVSCSNGVTFAIQKVAKCACAKCAVQQTIVRGKAVDPEGNPLKKGEITVGNGGGKYSTDLRGNFKIPVKPGTKRLVLTIKDKLQKLLEKTTKAITLNEGQVSFYTFVLQKKPPAIKFQATEEKKIPLGGSGGRPSYVDLDIPANSFLTADGNIYDGEITANIGVIDPRSQEDMVAAPGDFSAIDENGEEVMLSTAGILRQDFTDSNGNQLSLGTNITVRIDAGQLDISDDVPYFQWYMDVSTGRWVSFGELRIEYGDGASEGKRQARKFFVGEITPDVPYDTINWDSPTVASHVRIRAPPGTVVTRIGLTGNGLQYDSYRQATVPASGTLCILSYRDRPAILQAELDGAPLLPQQPINFPAAVNPRIIDGSSVGNLFKIQSFQFTSTKVDDRGPVYLKGEEGRCAQHRASDFAFEFQEANAGQLFDWNSPRNGDPADPRFWNVRTDGICFVKARVTGSNLDSVIYVKSTGKASGQPDVDYGYSAQKSEVVGSEGVVCLEYRCNEGPQVAYQTHLQVLTLTGTCTIQALNGILSGRQSQCPVTPSADSSREENFCVPSDLVGGDAGLYIGDSGVARSRCLTGNNQYNAGRPITSSRNPTVTLNCS